ncbi:hypothetical protein SAMCFNEI73_Ch2769 [Sinorhizobium americanum]|uniref:Uncharacterized protein n=1 Tax=Sinorhizobium americanum TaxID=194963 RepID=A0A1L3LPL1_9HYPH|nr:hypothetical protein SAMCCGM7_Ch2648 [Sinorhizobium americanum CCGM7]APG92042.1 hypothetical protein SAMCFNEI73_Ch2769 [Sinorhizobium americanum]
MAGVPAVHWSIFSPIATIAVLVPGSPALPLIRNEYTAWREASLAGCPAKAQNAARWGMVHRGRIES